MAFISITDLDGTKHHVNSSSIIRVTQNPDSDGAVIHLSERMIYTQEPFNWVTERLK